ncbi:MAG: murein hydrolase activator [Sphingomonadales bacterium]|jgi:septal ring factor EnvC (AmiA/AmiB activator)|nr:murein hydrolase activator [Sphingomonadales bacterium]MEA3044628.1 murein hydrolase activator [Sphingomonadales bacterium]MEA3046215.1 murein hydrolase activator [Sphingomonadales bacterium]
MRLFAPLALIALLLAGAGAVQAARGNDAEALAVARREAAAATERSRALDNAARRATTDADRARAASEALAGRIEAAEADLTVAERRIAFIAAQQALQRARLAQRQGPIIRLTAALQTMTRRPAALALVQPGSVRDAIHVRSLLAAALPEIRRRTAALRLEARRSADLRARSELAVRGLVDSREALRQRRVALAGFEAAQRTRSQQLTGLALTQSDRALVYGEEAQALQSAIGTRQSDSAVAASLARLPGPLPRPAQPGPEPPVAETLPYSLPVEGRVVTGVGEISDGGVHARGLTFETAVEARVIAPAAGRIVYAAPFRRYGNVVIIDHGRGWMTVLTDLGSIGVRAGQNVGRGALVGRAGTGAPRVTLELRRNGRPVPVAQLISG